MTSVIENKASIIEGGMTKNMLFRPIEILLAEDSAADVALTKLVFSDSNINNNVNVVDDGVEVMEFLRREPSYKSAPRPDLILLDVNMPRKNGLETLAEIRADAALCTIPIVMLTMSQAEKDILQSYRLHANSYIVKPVELDKFIEIVKGIERFWFSIVTLPNQVE
jgi:CheY-like chemotaxis protein